MQFLVKIFAMILVPVGLVALMLPIPGAFLVLALGITMLIATSEKSRKHIRALRARYTRFNRSMEWLEDRTGERVGAILRQTQPFENDEV